MMQFLIQTLLASAAVQAIVGNKIYPQTATQGATIPYITAFVVSDVPQRCREGIATEAARIQVNAIARSYGECDALYRAIRFALDGAKGGNIEAEYENSNDLQREEGAAHGKAIDFELITT